MKNIKLVKYIVLNNKMSFSDKVILVTGASSGIGAAICLKFSTERASIVLVGRNKIKMEEVAKKCIAIGGNPLIIVADLMIDADIKRVFTILTKNFATLDVVVNNAGNALSASILSENAIKVFDDTMAINLRAAVLITHFAAPHLIKTKGSIINISSVGSSKLCFKINSQYCTSKAGLDQFTKSVALELAPHQVRVNSVNPGPVKTSFMESLGLSGEQQKQLWNTLLKGTVLNRIIEPNEIAELVLFLASDKAKSITGSSFVIDSGLSLKGL